MLYGGVAGVCSVVLWCSRCVVLYCGVAGVYSIVRWYSRCV